MYQSSQVSPLLTLNPRRTLEETKEIIRKMEEIGNPKPALEFIKLDVKHDLYEIHVFLNCVYLQRLKLQLDFGPNECVLQEMDAKNVICKYDESFPIWQHIVKIENLAAPYNSYDIKYIQIDSDFHHKDLDLILMFLFFNTQHLSKKTFDFTERDYNIMKQPMFRVFAPGFRVLADKFCMNVNHQQFLILMNSKDDVYVEHLIVQRYDHCRSLQLKRHNYHIDTLTLYNFPTSDVFEIINKIKNLKRLEVLDSLYNDIDSAGIESLWWLATDSNIPREFIQRQHPHLSLEISAKILQNKDNHITRLLLKIVEELNRIPLVYFLSGDNSKEPFRSSLLGSSFFFHRAYDRNLIGILASMLGIRSK